ncbi:MAG TPA: DUF4198 domain-containing protein [Thermoanaerobaculia bacterium]
MLHGIHFRARLRVTGLLFALATGGQPLLAHDFWLDPSTYTPAVGARVAVRLRVGQQLRGDPMPRDPQHIVRFVALGAGGEVPVVGVPGVDPAGFVSFAAPGEYLLVYRSQHASLELAADKFEQYLKDEGLETIVAARARKGQSAAMGREIYSRCAKAFLSVGALGAAAKSGYDRPVGLTLELVPDVDPVSLTVGQSLSARLLYEKAPLAGAKVVAIPAERPEDQVSARSDAKGRVRLPLAHGGMWLVKAVHMIAAPQGSGADWESFWASLTFALPGAAKSSGARR